MKKCRGECQETKPLDKFRKNCNSNDGHASTCAACTSEIVKLRRYLKRTGQTDSILFKRSTFATNYPGVVYKSFQSWVYKHSEYKSLKGVFGDELDQLVYRYIDRKERMVK